MGEPRGRPRLALEAPTATPNHARAGQDLDGDLAVQALVVGQPNRGGNPPVPRRRRRR